jgi:hypothetical protein
MQSILFSSVCPFCHLTGARSYDNVVEHRQAATLRRCCSVRAIRGTISRDFDHGPNCVISVFLCRPPHFLFITFPFLDSPRQINITCLGHYWIVACSSIEQAAVSVPPRGLTVSRLAAREFQRQSSRGSLTSMFSNLHTRRQISKNALKSNGLRCGSFLLRDPGARDTAGRFEACK